MYCRSARPNFDSNELRPRLRPHVQIHRHHYRGQRWYVIQDAVTGRYHRFTPMAYRIIGFMDGRRTLGSIWQQAVETLGDDVPTQGEVLRLAPPLILTQPQLDEGLDVLLDVLR